MFNFYNKNEVREKIRDLKFIAKKSFGQNFLIDQNVCEKIVEVASEKFSDGVVEIGPGLGTMTYALSKKFKKVLSIELDYKLFDFLKSSFKEISNVKLVNADALKINLDDLFENFKDCKSIVMCSNLPYCITTPAIMRFLEYNKFSQITVMIQKEAADRILSSPGTRNCGSISSAVRFYSDPKFNFNVSKNCFFPSPKVESSVISFEITKNYIHVNQKKLFKVLKSAFRERRKNILNSISSGMHMEKSKISEILISCDLDKNLRAENLSLEDFINISNLI